MATTTQPAVTRGTAPTEGPPRVRRRFSLTPYAFLLPGFALFCLIVNRWRRLSLLDGAVLPDAALID